MKEELKQPLWAQFGATIDILGECYERIHGLTETGWNERWTNGRKNYSSFEILLYNLRHIQHHTGQLNLLLRQGMNKAPGWLSQAKEG